MTTPDVRDLIASLPHQTRVCDFAECVVRADHYPAYARLFAALGPSTLLEYGTLVGYSLVTAAHALPGLRRVEWVDTEAHVPGSNRMAADNLAFALSALGRDGVESRYFSDPRTAAPTVPVDLVHIDADHSYAGVAADLAAAERLGPRWVVGHDYHLPSFGGVRFGVREAVRAFCDARGLPHLSVRLNHGAFVVPLAGDPLGPVADALAGLGAEVHAAGGG